MKTIKGTLPGGLVIDGVAHREFEMREANVGDMFDAENEVDVTRPMTFNGQMMLHQLVCIGTFKGPFTIGMLRSLKTTDYGALRSAQMKLEELGEADGSAGQAS